ncbi:MAG: hypothetical protein RR253_00875 [Oscillospiraceae bacterium]
MAAINKHKGLEWPKSIKTYDKILFGTAFLLSFLFMSHPDLWETANHSYVFLESVFSGNFMNFYEVTALHANSYYYINVANYNIIIYVIFGLWELPVYIFNQIFHLPLNETFIIFWAKLVSVGFFVGCGVMLKKLCENIGLEKSTAGTVALFFLFNPIAFYSPMAMGQYDTLCLFFTLWALSYYVKGDYTRFSFIIGIGVVCKFFPLLIFVPLILIAEKRILPLIKYGLISLWLYIPTTLLFLGRTGNAAAFTQTMIDRMFELTMGTGFSGVSVFTLCYALIVFVAFLYTPKTEKMKKYLAIYLPMVVFGILFNSIYWHPQWLILFIPFVVATTFMQKNKAPWFYLDMVMAVGFFMLCFYQFPNQTGGILFDGGLAHYAFGLCVATSDKRLLIDYFLSLISYVYVLTPVMFTGSIFANIILKMPLGEKTIADRLSTEDRYDKIPTKVFGYGIFIIGFLGAWFMPSLLEALNAFGVI